VDFKNTIIIMTSNIGAGECEKRSAGLGFGAEDKRLEDRDILYNALKKHFKPEFLNRVDEIIVFNPLSREDLCKIVRLMLDDVCARAENLDLSISFDKSVEELILSKAEHSEYGARPLRRAIVREVEDALSAALLDGEIRTGDTVEAFVKNGRVCFGNLIGDTVTFS
jgi:ATP-dependent Clp protease ATP-binding subunit ClpC